MECEKSFNDVLNKNRVEVVERLHLERTFLFDYLLSKSVFDRNDCDLVRAQPTREGKASKFLDILETKGPDGLDHFVNALQLVNPSLYELVTGEKATTKPSPIINGYSSSADSVDLEILSNYAKRVTGDIQDMTIRYEQVLKEKEQLQRALKEENDKYHSEKRQKEILQQKISETEEILKNKANRRAREEDEQFAHHMKCIHEDNDTKQFIIQLQMRLLAAHDENENIMRHMMQRLEQVDRSSDREIQETFRLSQKLISQSEEMKSFREYRCKNPLDVEQLQYEMLKQQEEMKDLKNWTEALKMRFDIAMEERDEVLGIREDLAQDCSKLKDDLSQLEIKFNRIKRENEDLKKNCQELEENEATYRQQRDFHEREMKAALIKRDQAIHELDEITRRYKEDLELKERTIRQQTGDERTFEKQCREMKAELSRVRTQLRETLQANEELRTTVAGLQTPRTTYTSSSSQVGSVQPEPETASNEQEPGENEPERNTFAFSWQERSTSAVVDSIKRRVWNNSEACRESVTARPTLYRKSLSLDDKLGELVPAFKYLSPEAKKGFSLDRLQPRKVLPYETIFGMSPLSSSLPRPCPAASGRSRRMTEPSALDMGDVFTCDDCGSDDAISSEKGRNEEKGDVRDAEPQKSSDTQDSSHRPRSGAIHMVRRRNARRCHSRDTNDESQDLSD